MEFSDIVLETFRELEGDFSIEEIQRVLLAQQTAITTFLQRGCRVSQYGYMTFYTSTISPRNLRCPVDGKDYMIPRVVKVNVRIGEKLKRAIQTQSTSLETDLSTTKAGEKTTTNNPPTREQNAHQTTRETTTKGRPQAGGFDTPRPEREKEGATTYSSGGK